MIGMNIILNQMFIFSIFILIGYISYKRNLFNESSLEGLSIFVLKITLPCMVFNAVTAKTTKNELLSSWKLIILGAVIIGFLLLLGYISAKLTRLKDDTLKAHTIQMGFGNSGFIGIPLISALFGTKGAFYLSLYEIASQIGIWTLAINLVGEKTNKFNFKKLLNPVFLGIIFGMIVVLLDITIPTVIGNTISDIGSTTGVISMIYTGGLLATIDTKNIFNKYQVYLIAIIKMIIAPVIVAFLLNSFTNFSDIAILTYSIITAFPCLVITAIFAKNANRDYEYVLSSIFITTVLSIFTIPLVIYIVSNFII